MDSVGVLRSEGFSASEIKICVIILMLKLHFHSICLVEMYSGIVHRMKQKTIQCKDGSNIFSTGNRILTSGTLGSSGEDTFVKQLNLKAVKISPIFPNEFYLIKILNIFLGL